MAVNITVDQQQGSFQQASVLEPLTTFLGDHVASVQLATSAPTSTGQVQAFHFQIDLHLPCHTLAGLALQSN